MYSRVIFVPSSVERSWWIHCHTCEYIEGLITRVLEEVNRTEGDRFDDAAAIFEEVALGEDFPSFLTIPAYNRFLVESA